MTYYFQTQNYPIEKTEQYRLISILLIFYLSYLLK